MLRFIMLSLEGYDGGYGNLVMVFFFLYSTIYNVFYDGSFFLISYSSFCCSILFFLPFRMFVDSLDYFKCKED